MAGNNIDAGRTVTGKVAAILSTFTEGSEHSMAEIARLTGLPLSTAHRLISELVSWQFLERSPRGQYRVGLTLRMIGSVDVAPPPSLSHRARCVLEDISASIKRRVRLGVLRGIDVAYIEKVAGPSPTTAFSSGATLPAHPTAMGRALLAFSPTHVVDQAIESGRSTHIRPVVSSPDRFRHALAVTRLTRVAITHPGFEPVHAAAMPVFGCGGRVVAAIEVTLENLQWDMPSAVGTLRIASRSLSRELSSGAQRAEFAPYSGADRSIRTA